MSEEEKYFIVEEELEIHPYAKVMPEMEPEMYEKFKNDIAGNGLRHPIVLFEGKVFDGKHRYKACRELCIDVVAMNYDAFDITPVEFLINENIYRRHLTAEQISKAQAEFLEIHIERARQRWMESREG